MYIGLQDMFKIGIGPSSSHTVGPMRAARRFVMGLPEDSLGEVQRVQVELFGSLAHTGHGHGTDLAILMGLCGEVPDSVDTISIAQRVATIRCECRLVLADEDSYHLSHYTRLLKVASNVAPSSAPSSTSVSSPA